MNEPFIEKQKTTRKIQAITKKNELEYAQEQYDLALKNMLENKTIESILSFEIANTRLYEVQDAYRIGRRLKLEFLRMKDVISQKLHLL